MCEIFSKWITNSTYLRMKTDLTCWIHCGVGYSSNVCIKLLKFNQFSRVFTFTHFFPEQRRETSLVFVCIWVETTLLLLPMMVLRLFFSTTFRIILWGKNRVSISSLSSGRRGTSASAQNLVHLSTKDIDKVRLDRNSRFP